MAISLEATVESKREGSVGCEGNASTDARAWAQRCRGAVLCSHKEAGHLQHQPTPSVSDRSANRPPPCRQPPALRESDLLYIQAGSLFVCYQFYSSCGIRVLWVDFLVLTMRATSTPKSRSSNPWGKGNSETGLWRTTTAFGAEKGFLGRVGAAHSGGSGCDDFSPSVLRSRRCK